MSGTLCGAARRELENPAPVGQRHAQIVRLVPLMLSDGFSTSEIFFRLRAKYDPATFPDAEISAVIEWAERKIPKAGEKSFFHCEKIQSGFPAGSGKLSSGLCVQ